MFSRLLGIVLGTLICAGVSAQSLEDRVRELERRVQQLEQQAAPAAEKPAPPAAPPVSAAKPAAGQPELLPQYENWRSLKRGMTENEVRGLLGVPLRMISLFMWRTWDYPAGGVVRFDRDGKVDGWSEPR